MKKIMFFLIFFLSFSMTCFCVSGYEIDCSMAYDSYIIRFQNKTEDGELLTDTNFSLFNIDKSASSNISFNNNKNYFDYTLYSGGISSILELDRFVGDYNKILSSSQKEWINSIQSFNDIKNYYETGKYTYNYESREDYLESIKNSDGIEFYQYEEPNNAKIFINTFLKVEQTKTKSGYEKEYFIVPVYLLFNYNDGNLVFLNVKPKYYTINSNFCNSIYNAFLLKYNKNLNYNNYYETISSMDDTYLINNNCNINFTLGDVYRYENNTYNYPRDGSCIFTITNRQGTPNIVVEGTLNNEENISIEEDSVVNYKMIVKNESNTPSSNNIIKSIIPSGIEYVNNSASNDGEYNEEENSVIWNIDLIDAEEEISLTYKVKVKGNTNNQYNFQTTVSNRENGKIKSVKNTITTSGVDNPKTGNNTQFIIVILLAISMILFLLFLNKQKAIENL